MVRDPSHGKRIGLSLVARSERDFEEARGLHCVVTEKLVEIPHPEKKQRIGNRVLQFPILLHEGSGFGGHLDSRRGRYLRARSDWAPILWTLTMLVVPRLSVGTPAVTTT